MTDQEYRDKARKLYQEDEIQIDDNAEVARADPSQEEGAYVQAWLWVSLEEAR